MPGDKPFVLLDSVGKVFSTAEGDVVALSDVSLHISEGEFVSILGPSGCGKSTLLMIAAGLLPSSSGKVFIEDELVTKPYTNLGIVFQNHVLLEWRTAIENILFQAEMRHLPRNKYTQKAKALLSMVSLDGFENKYPHELSGGMRQRVAICRALLHDPPLLMMDEPFGALDALTRDQLSIDLEKILLQQQKTVLFITHSIQEAVQLSDRVIVMTPRPGRVYHEFKIPFGRPRYETATGTAEYLEIIEEIKKTFIEQGVLRR